MNIQRTGNLANKVDGGQVAFQTVQTNLILNSYLSFLSQLSCFHFREDNFVLLQSTKYIVLFIKSGFRHYGPPERANQKTEKNLVLGHLTIHGA